MPRMHTFAIFQELPGHFGLPVRHTGLPCTGKRNFHSAGIQQETFSTENNNNWAYLLGENTLAMSQNVSATSGCCAPKACRRMPSALLAGLA